MRLWVKRQKGIENLRAESVCRNTAINQLGVEGFEIGLPTKNKASLAYFFVVNVFATPG